MTTLPASSPPSPEGSREPTQAAPHRGILPPQGSPHPGAVGATMTSARDGVHAGAMIGAPVLILASSIAYGVIGSEIAGGAIGILGSSLMVVAAPGITRQMDATMPRVAATLTGLFMFCFAIGGVGFNLESILVANGAPSMDTLAVFPVIAVPGVLGPLVLAAIGVMLFRAGAAPRFAPIALALGALLFPVSRIGEIAPLAIAVDLLLAVALVALAWTLLRSSSSAGRGTVAAPTGPS